MAAGGANGDRSANHTPAELYRLLVEQVQDYAIFALDPRGYILTWNVGAERLKGYSANEIIGKHFSIFYPSEDIADGKPARELEIAAAVGHVQDEGWRLRQDGSRFWGSVLITALHDEDGNLIAFGKITRDLTERRRTEEALRLSEERFRLLVHSVRDYAIFMLDPDGCVATWNEGAQRIKGYSEEEIVGKHFSIFYPPEDVAAGKLERELSIAVNTGQYAEEGWRVRKDGSRFWAHVIIKPIYGADGHLAGFAKVTRDLTERRAAEAKALNDARRIARQEAARAAAEDRAKEMRTLARRLHAQTDELQRRSDEAEEASRAKSEFLAAMSHELRTPLNAIGGYAQLMQLGLSGPVTTAQLDHLERIQRSQQHLLGVINDILNFSRIEAGQVDYEVRTVVVNDVLEAMMPMVELQARGKHIALTVDACPPSVRAWADQSKVEQILLNLLSNAVKFTAAGGAIEVMCENHSENVRLKVRDTGVGIPAADLEEIFAPFVQVGRSLSSPKEGTGLGLAISRDLARGMGGDLSVVSKVGFGSTFTLTLPIGPAEVGSASAPS